jgi:murein DD-endopeptidase MepM/ murein hydrolase activator NlpD
MIKRTILRGGRIFRLTVFRFSIAAILAALLCAGAPYFFGGRSIAQNAWAGASFPVENFQAYTSGFGYRSSPMDGSTQFHYGLDLAAPLGSYIRNWWTGQIVELSDHSACGTMVKIRSGQWTHIYCHLMGSVESNGQSTYLIDREGGILLGLGQEIPVGARMARVGMTGRTTGPHLHWGLQYGGQYVDPALVLNAMYGSRPSGNS